MASKIYFADSAVRITDTDAHFGGRHFAISEIASARIVTQIDRPPKTKLWWIATILAMTLLLSSVALSTIKLFYFSEERRFIFTELPLILLVAGLTINVYANRNQKIRSFVRITGEFGESDVVLARHISYSQRIVNAINLARKIHDRDSVPKPQPKVQRQP